MNKNPVFIAAILTAGFVFADGSKHDKGGAQHHHPSFEEMDANKDGKVSLEEFKSAAPKDAPAEKVEAKFKKFDTNADGSITKEEFDAAVQKMKEHTAANGDKAGGTK
jgi:Ca2+-binding EF-hand superfamily protein